MVGKKLKDLCQEYIIRNIDLIFNIVKETNVTLPMSLSEVIFECLEDKDFGIKEEYLELFQSNKTLLQTVKFFGRRIKAKRYLNFLKFHPIKYLTVRNLLAISVSEWLIFVNKENLEELNISGCKFSNIEIENYPKDLNTENIDYLKGLINLVKLDVSYTDFSDNHFTLICSECLKLKELDISGTLIQNLQFVHKLKNLTAFKFCTRKSMLKWNEYSHIMSLKDLRVINIGMCIGDDESKEREVILTDWISDFLLNAKWDNLETISISEYCDINLECLR